MVFFILQMLQLQGMNEKKWIHKRPMMVVMNNNQQQVVSVVEK